MDDNQDSVDSMVMLLELLGNQVYTARDGIEAIEAAERFRPDLVLMDMGMPRMNGYDATRRIREQPWGREMIIIALTGWGQEDDKVRSVRGRVRHAHHQTDRRDQTGGSARRAPPAPQRFLSRQSNPARTSPFTQILSEKNSD